MRTRLLIGAIALVFIGVIGVAVLQHPSVSYVAPASASTDLQAQSNASNANQTQQATNSQDAASRSGTSASASSSGSPAPQSQTQSSSGYTMAMVAKHDTASSCWTAIDGSVYDLTGWINQHPGGPGPILSLCGTDGSSMFNAQHGGQRRPAQELSQFLLGPLAR